MCSGWRRLLEGCVGVPFFDRFWWVRRIVALVAAIFCLLAFLRLVAPSIAPPVTLAALASPSDLWLALALSVVTLISAVPLWVSAGPARDRRLRRERALVGDPDAMPRARLPRIENNGQVHRVRRPLPRPPRRLPWAPAERLAVYWRAGWFDRIYAGFLALVALGGLIAALAVLVPFVRFLITGEPRGVLDLALGAIALCIVLLPVALYLLYWAIPALLGRRPGVEVTPDGISARQLWGGRQAMRWEDARLLEVTAPRRIGLKAPHRTFRLYGTRSVAVWRDELRPLADYRLELFEPDRPYQFQLRERMDALLDHVLKRTGLVPRTFSPRLAAPPPESEDAAPLGARTDRRRGGARWLVSRFGRTATTRTK